MIRSMTGYGSAERDTPAGRLRVELKTVNHRYFSANIRTPSSLERHEGEIREWLRSAFPRGHANYSLRLESPDAEPGQELPLLRLDEARARQYYRLLTELKELLDLPGEVDVALLSRFSDLIVRGEGEAVEIEVDELLAVTRAATREVIAMREAEGRRLHDDLEERLSAIEQSTAAVAELAPKRLVSERDRLRKAVAELAGDAGADEERLAREIAYMAERWDISEELVRMRSHIEHFREFLDAEAEEAVGKRLGFLVQEMHREANTMGSKANDAGIEHEVVSIKNEIERLREQVDNVE